MDEIIMDSEALFAMYKKNVSDPGYLHDMICLNGPINILTQPHTMIDALRLCLTDAPLKNEDYIASPDRDGAYHVYCIKKEGNNPDKTEYDYDCFILHKRKIYSTVYKKQRLFAQELTDELWEAIFNGDVSFMLNENLVDGCACYAISLSTTSSGNERMSDDEILARYAELSANNN